jgi:FtsP/CotA-like multicopper oxidase with cupredoxin domain
MPSRRELVGRAAVAVAVVTAVGAGTLAWSSTLLGEYSVMDMGAAAGDHGDHGGHGGHAGGIDVTSLVADPDRPADVRVELTARQETIDVPGGRSIEGYTVNGTSPGPELRARQGDLVEV